MYSDKIVEFKSELDKNRKIQLNQLITVIEDVLRERRQQFIENAKVEFFLSSVYPLISDGQKYIVQFEKREDYVKDFVYGQYIINPVEKDLIFKCHISHVENGKPDIIEYPLEFRYDLMDWRKLSRSATEEIKHRINNKLLYIKSKILLYIESVFD